MFDFEFHPWCEHEAILAMKRHEVLSKHKIQHLIGQSTYIHMRSKIESDTEY